MQTRVLFVEDNNLTRVACRRIFKACNCDVTEAENGAEGVERCAQKKFDLILMDNTMPKMCGVEAIKQIRESGLNKETFTVLITSEKFEQQNLIDRGFNAYIEKPLSEERLRKVLDRLATDNDAEQDFYYVTRSEPGDISLGEPVENSPLCGMCKIC